MTEHVVAIFDSENAADAAARELEKRSILGHWTLSA